MFEYENNYSQSISSFIGWAHDRLHKEIKQNKEIENQYGTSEIFKDQIKLPNNLSFEEKLEYVYEVDRLRDKFLHLSKAEVCSLAGLYLGTYYKWKKQALNAGLYNKTKI